MGGAGVEGDRRAGAARACQQSDARRTARARLAQAQELRTARTGVTQLPQFDAAFGAERQRIDPATFGFPQAPNPGPFNVFTLGVSVSYNFDLFGGTRRELEALAADVDYYGSFELEAARLALAGNVVGTAIRQASLHAQAEAVAAILAAQRRQLAIVEDRYASGGVARFDVQSQRSLVAQTEATLRRLRGPSRPRRATCWRSWSANPRDGRPPRGAADRPSAAGRASGPHPVRTGPPAPGHPGQRGAAPQGERQRRRGHG